MDITYYIIWLFIGLIAGFAYIKYAENGHSGREKRIYIAGLLIAAFVYILFAIIWGDLQWVAIETAGFFAYGFLAYLGRRSSFYFVAIGWLLHPIWDIWLHLHGMGSHVVPAWYAIACVSFDFLVAGVIAYKVYNGALVRLRTNSG